MMRYFLFSLMFLLALTSSGQDKFAPLMGKYPSSKRLGIVDTLKFKLNYKGQKSFKESFNEGDTIVYVLTKERKRKASFSLFDSNPTPAVENKFENNIMSGAFVVNGLGTYLFDIKNRSYFGNNYTLDIKKTIPLPNSDSVKCNCPNTNNDSIYVTTTDSIKILLDSTFYIASTLNINKASEFIIPFLIEKKYDCYILKPEKVSLFSLFINKNKNIINKRDTLNCMQDTAFQANRINVTLLLIQSGSKWDLKDSLSIALLEQQVPKICINTDELYCKKSIGKKGAQQKLIVANTEKVPGKKISVKVIEIFASPKKVKKKKNKNG